MIIVTKAIGEIQINDDEVIYFPEGILAFEEFHRYAIVSEKENAIFKWMQSLDDPELAFLIVNPMDITTSYQPVLHHQALELIDNPSAENVNVWCIVTVPPNSAENMTVNLQGPLIINNKKKLGGQFISSSVKHGVKARILDLIEKNEA